MAKLTVHSSGNREHAIDKGASPGKVKVVPNWVDTEFLQPGPTNNELRRSLGLEGKFVVSFAGGRPVIAVMDLSGDAPRLIEEARCGLALPAEDAHGVLDRAITFKYNNNTEGKATSV